MFGWQRLAVSMAKIGGMTTVVDIGTYNIKAALAERVSDGFKILGYSTVKSNGFSAEGVVDAVGLRASIGEALGELQSQMNKKVSFGDLLITTSSDIFQMEEKQIENVLSKDKPEVVKESHIKDIYSALMKQDDIVDVIPVRYKLDDGRSVANPISMLTTKMLSDVVLVKIKKKARDEILSLFDEYDFISISMSHPGILAAEGVLNESEKDRGILCLEMGYSTTKVIAYANGVPVGFRFVPLGVYNIIKDIAKVFKVSYAEAERLLFYHSNLNYEEIEESEVVETTDFDNKTKKEVKKRSISLTAYARIREILSISRRSINQILNDPGFSPVGVVITGGGASIPGISNVGSSVYNMTSRTGTYASSNNVIVNGAEDVMASAPYSLLFGAFVHRFRYGLLSGKTFNVVLKTSSLSAGGNEGKDRSNEMSFLKRVWEFLKKLV